MEPDDAAVLRQIQQDLVRAWTSGDREDIERIYAPEWSVTGANGVVSTRAQVLADGFETKTLVVRTGTIDHVDVRLFGSTAVVTGRTVATGAVSGVEFSARIRFTDTFI